MNANLTRRHFILTATSAAGGLMIGIGTAPKLGSRDRRRAAVERG
jgi:hypothetical protein